MNAAHDMAEAVHDDLDRRLATGDRARVKATKEIGDVLHIDDAPGGGWTAQIRFPDGVRSYSFGVPGKDDEIWRVVPLEGFTPAEKAALDEMGDLLTQTIAEVDTEIMARQLAAVLPVELVPATVRAGVMIADEALRLLQAVPLPDVARKFLAPVLGVIDALSKVVGHDNPSPLLASAAAPVTAAAGAPTAPEAPAAAGEAPEVVQMPPEYVDAGDVEEVPPSADPSKGSV